MTTVVEIGFLVTILTGASVTAFIVALLGFHTVVVLAMGIFFFDAYFFLMLFFAHDNVYSQIASDRDLRVVYDGACYISTRGLYVIRLLDINETVEFLPRTQAPIEHSKQDMAGSDARVHVFANGERYSEYEKAEQLCRQFPITAPVSWLLSLPPAKAVGNRVYDHVSTNPERYFICDGGAETE